MNKINYDIGYLTNRQEIAAAMNFNLYPIIEMNIETPQEGWDDVFQGNNLRLEYHFKGDNYNHYLIVSPEIYLNNHGEENEITDENILNSEYFYLTRGGIGLTSHFGYSDVIELSFNNQNVIVYPEKPVCVIFNKPQERKVYIRLMKLSKADPYSTTVCRVLPLSKDELDDELLRLYEIIRDREKL